MRRLIIFFALAMMMAPVAQAQKQMVIAAIVNDEIITNHDIEQRMDVVISSSGIKDSLEARQRIFPQLMQSMINETLQRQEAERLGIALTEKEIALAIGQVEKQNKVPPGGFEQFIAAQGVDKAVVMEQLRNQLLWKKLLARRVRPRITLSEFEMEDAMARMKNTQETQQAAEVFLSEIVLPVERPEDEQDVRQLAQKLIEELNAGADFGAIAKQFSASRNARNKGIIGWIAQGDLGKEIRVIIENVAPDTISPPIRTSRGYHIMKVHDRRFKDGAEKVAAELDEKKVRDFLTLQKMDLEARRYMTDLRREAFIEIRL